MSGDAAHGADLHLHTVYSDGTYSPQELVAAARRVRLASIAVTDHDTLDGVRPTREAAGANGPEVIAGVEFGTATDDNSVDEIHITGLFLDETHVELLETLERQRLQRRERALEMVAQVNRCGMRLDAEDVFALAPRGNVSRLHIAKALLQRGHVGTLGEAFARWIGQNGPAFVPRMRPPIVEIIALIHRAGGIAVMAHPAKTNRDGDIPAMVAAGLDGIEAFGGDSTRDHEKRYLEMAKELGLLPCGGSDCHGSHKDRTVLGQVRLDKERLEALRERAARFQVSGVRNGARVPTDT